MTAATAAARAEAGNWSPFSVTATDSWAVKLFLTMVTDSKTIVAPLVWFSEVSSMTASSTQIASSSLVTTSSPSISSPASASADPTVSATSLVEFVAFEVPEQ